MGQSSGAMTLVSGVKHVAVSTLLITHHQTFAPFKNQNDDATTTNERGNNEMLMSRAIFLSRRITIPLQIKILHVMNNWTAHALNSISNIPTLNPTVMTLLDGWNVYGKSAMPSYGILACTCSSPYRIRAFEVWLNILHQAINTNQYYRWRQ